jgi:hypothetical protein
MRRRPADRVALGVRSVGLALLVSLAAGAARADVASDQAGAILVFPKIFVDTSNVAGRGKVDTLIRVSNTSTSPIAIRCFYANATPSCSNGDGTCLWPNVTGQGGCTGTCEVSCQEEDFAVYITARQPIAWLASQGAGSCAQATNPDLPCFPLMDNAASVIPAVPTDPFIGELKCVAVDRNDVPVARNDLKGEVEIVRVDVPGGNLTTDVETYNAIGIPAAGTNSGDNTLMLGGNLCDGGSNDKGVCAGAADCPGGSCVSVGEYSGCPNVLILDHFFDGAFDPVSVGSSGNNVPVTTVLTLVPCSEDFLNPDPRNPLTTTVQFLVFNEFEQRLSTSRPVTCFDERPIWSILNTSNQNKSIFSAAVSGTLTGQTRIMGVPDKDTKHGHGLLGVAEEFRAGGGAAAFNLHFSGSRPQGDLIYLP